MSLCSRLQRVDKKANETMFGRKENDVRCEHSIQPDDLARNVSQNFFYFLCADFLSASRKSRQLLQSIERSGACQ